MTPPTPAPPSLALDCDDRQRSAPAGRRRLLRRGLGLGMAAVLGPLAAARAGAHADAGADPEAWTPAERSRALERARRAVLGVQVLALEGARSIRTLGPLRLGSGVLIGADGLVLTIGYLVLEADAVLLQPDDGGPVPARVLAYDVATGLGLVRALAPLPMAPVPLARTGAAEPGEGHTVVSGGEDGEVSPARLLSVGPFSGYWEYHLDRALVTVPPRRDHSGAALLNARGELVGIGSLLLPDVSPLVRTADGEPRVPRQPGNVFVPAELLPPILDELLRRGHSRASDRAWLGVNCAEFGDGLRVLRVQDDSPAEVAGLQPGDRILRLDGQPVATLAALWKALWAGAVERPVQLEIQRGDEAQTLTVHTVDRARTLRRAEGI